MAHQALLLLVVVATVVVYAMSAAAEIVVDGASTAGWMRPGPNSRGGRLEECLGEHEVGGDGGGFLLRRRQLVDDGAGYGDDNPPQYISYAALARNSVPCSVPGASYYNCRPGAVANPYTRGCSAITQCRD